MSALNTTQAEMHDPLKVLVQPATGHIRLTGEPLMILIYKQMRLLAGTHPDLDDLAQTALEQTLLADYAGRSKFSTFTYAICYRVWLKHLRSRYRFFARFEFLERDNEIECPQELPDLKLRAIERYSRLYRALDQVSPKLRAAVSFHDIGGLDIEDIAQIVGARSGTVRSRLRDGRKRLATLLQADPYFGDSASEERS